MWHDRYQSARTRFRFSPLDFNESAVEPKVRPVQALNFPMSNAGKGTDRDKRNQMWGRTIEPSEQFRRSEYLNVTLLLVGNRNRSQLVVVCWQIAPGLGEVEQCLNQ